ncbi:DUF3781 domain-containing protein [Treponema sp.]
MNKSYHTDLSIVRIKRNLCFLTNDIVSWCK